jgi:hypothetical protein
MRAFFLTGKTLFSFGAKPFPTGVRCDAGWNHALVGLDLGRRLAAAQPVASKRSIISGRIKCLEPL